MARLSNRNLRSKSSLIVHGKECTAQQLTGTPASAAVGPPKRKRGRPPKHSPPSSLPVVVATAAEPPSEHEVTSSKRKRGRPRKPRKNPHPSSPLLVVATKGKPPSEHGTSSLEFRAAAGSTKRRAEFVLLERQHERPRTTPHEGQPTLEQGAPSTDEAILAHLRILMELDRFISEDLFVRSRQLLEKFITDCRALNDEQDKQLSGPMTPAGDATSVPVADTNDVTHLAKTTVGHVTTARRTSSADPTSELGQDATGPETTGKATAREESVEVVPSIE
ncbi:MAG: hypothetical protein Q9201_002970 [Fulgogasparrea decipioides]